MTNVPTEIDISSLNNLEQQDYEKILKDPQALAGIWESSKQGEHFYEEQREAASQNLKNAKQLNEKVKKVEDLRKKLAEARERLEIKHSEWAQAEGEMHSALEPYSMVGLKKQIQSLYNESNDICCALEKSFLDKNETLQPFLSEYQQQQYLKHIRKLKLEAM